MNKNIIIAILVVIIIAAAGFFLLGQSNGKMETQINIISDDTVQNGEQIQFELKDKQGNAISGQDLNITFKNQKYTIPTDQNGKAALTIKGQSAGSYDVSAEFGGNDKYDASSAKAKITITDDEVDSPATMTSGNSVKTTDDTNSNSNGNSSDDDNGTNGGEHLYYDYYVIDLSEGQDLTGGSELYVRTADNIVIDAPGGKGIGLDVDTWFDRYYDHVIIDDNSTDDNSDADTSSDSDG